MVDKIDYVVSYVDPTDKNWLELYSKFKFQNKNLTDDIKRFDKNKLFKYVFRGIDKYMPWINNVFLIVQSESQVPKWIDRDKVKVVYHNQFIPEKYLPVFNSSTIELFLWNIKELSEHFIYGNDDMFITNECSYMDFFDEQGCPINTLINYDYILTLNSVHQDNNLFQSDYVCSKLGLVNKLKYFRPEHIQNAYLKSEYLEIYKNFENDIVKSITRFRYKTNFHQYLFCLYYSLKNKKSTDKVMGEFFQEFKDYGYDKKLLCINKPDKNFSEVSRYFSKKFPDISKYEKSNKETAVFWSVDSNFIGNIMCMYSLYSASFYTDSNFYILTTKENKYSEYYYNISSKVKVIFVDDLFNQYIKNLESGKWSKFTWVRFLLFKIPELLKYRKLLYLDTDTYCVKEFDDLFSLDMNKSKIGMVPELYTKLVIPSIKLKDQCNDRGLTYRNKRYGNAGVILFNLDELRNESDKIFTDILNLADQKFNYNDQDVLNYYFQGGDICWLDGKYNVFKGSSSKISLGNNLKVFVHLCGKSPPYKLSKFLEECSKNINFMSELINLSKLDLENNNGNR